MEPPRHYGAVEPLAGGDAGGASAPRARRQADQAALHDAGQDPPAGVRGHVLECREDARQLYALPGQRVARRFRHAGHADPAVHALAGRQEPLQGQARAQRRGVDQASGQGSETGRQGAALIGAPRLVLAQGGRERVCDQTSAPLASIRVLPPRYGCRASGRVTDPSACWPFSSTAIRQRPTARPDPFSVWTYSGLPPEAGLNRAFIRRAWKLPQTETLEISR